MSADEKCRTISIDADAERGFEPDLFELTVGFYGEHDERKACVEAYNADLERVKAALVGAGIQPDEIKISEFKVVVHYDWLYEKVDETRNYYRRASRFTEGYEYSGDCTVKHVFDRKLLARIWSELQEIDGDFSLGFEFSLARPDECEKAILRKTFAEAQSRAAVLADAAGAKLGEVVDIHYRFGDALRDEPLVSRMRYGSAADEGSSAVPAFNPDEIEVRCNVSAIWEIE